MKNVRTKVLIETTRRVVFKLLRGKYEVFEKTSISFEQKAPGIFHLDYDSMPDVIVEDVNPEQFTDVDEI